MRLNKTCLSITLVLLIIEILIAVYIKTGFIRHTFGDYLVVILVYSFVKSFFSIEPLKLAIAVLAFAFFIEFLQLINILETLNLQNNQLIKIIVGNTYQTTDLVAYTLGIVTVLIIEYKIHKL